MRFFPIGALAALLTLVVAGSLATAAPSTTPPIERVWAFNGGEVAIQAQPNGTFAGTVIAPTKFATCTHPIGQQMWTNMRLQPDGSYWGVHQWYFEAPQCVENPVPGPTAWRVLQSANGSSYLLVCFSPPGGMQPTIAPNGATTNVGHPPCEKSAEIASIVKTSTEHLVKSVSLPSSQKCVSKRVFTVHLQEPKHDPFKEVDVTLGKRRIAVKRHGNLFTATIHLKGLPRGAFTIVISGTTVLGHHFRETRTYHTCAVKRKVGKSKPHKRTVRHG